MLKKENRLSADKDFGRVFKGSRPVYTQNLTFRVAKSNKSENRFGFVISNKISKLATRRNALKRQLRAIIEQELPSIKTGYDVVIMVKLDFSYPYKQDDIRKQAKEGLGKAGLLE